MVADPDDPNDPIVKDPGEAAEEPENIFKA
jgi:hypothetical protein